MGQERLQKILARGGIASRRAAEELIESGRVRVNGRVITELGARADPRRDRVEVDGNRVVAEQPVYLVLNKPRGFVTTLDDPEGRRTVADLIRAHGVKARVFPVGRLDFNTSGVLLFTNDGAFSDGLLHPKRAVPKTYVVKVDGQLEKEHLDRWRKGVQLEDGITQPAEVNFLRHEGDKTWFEITIKEGRNQQIRRMGQATSAPVMRLSRVAFAGIGLEGLKPGALRALRTEELVELKKMYGVPKSPGAAAHSAEASELAGRRTPGSRGAKRAEITRRRALVRTGRDEDARAAGVEKRPVAAPRVRRGAGRVETETPRSTEGRGRPTQRGGETRERRGRFQQEGGSARERGRPPVGEDRGARRGPPPRGEAKRAARFDERSGPPRERSQHGGREENERRPRRGAGRHDGGGAGKGRRRR